MSTRRAVPLLVLALALAGGLAWRLSEADGAREGAALTRAREERVPRPRVEEELAAPEEAADAEDVARSAAPPPAAEEQTAAEPPPPGADLLVRGRVVGALPGGAERLPVPGARLELLLDEHRRFRWLAATRAGADGAFAFEPLGGALLDELSDDARCVVYADARGFEPGELSVWKVWRHRGERELTVELARGAAVRGRVVDAGGRPVPAARVWLETTEVHGAFTTLADSGSVRTGGDGAFRIAPPSTRDGGVRSAVVVARKDGVGAGGATIAELAAGVDADVGTIVLGGVGRLAGVVVDAGGNPLERFELEAVHVGVLGRALGSSEASLRLERADSQPGLATCRTRTGPNGGFALEGLLPGEYALFTLREGDVRARLMDGALFHTGGGAVRVVVRRCLVVVRVVAADGSRRSGAAVYARGSANRERWLQAGSSRHDGRARFTVEVGEEVELFALQGERCSARTSFVATAASCGVERELVLDQDVKALFHPVGRGPDGRPDEGR